jgi:hypothetical protein
LIGDGISGICASNLEEQASKRSELKATAEGNMDSDNLTSVSVGTSWNAFAHLFALRERELFATRETQTQRERERERERQTDRQRCFLVKWSSASRTQNSCRLCIKHLHFCFFPSMLFNGWSLYLLATYGLHLNTHLVKLGASSNCIFGVGKKEAGWTQI